MRKAHRHAVAQPEDPTIRLIPLTQGKNAIVDAADYEWLSQWNWHTHAEYAGRTIEVAKQRRVLLMHKVLTDYPITDHINGDGLDNRRANLRPANTFDNARNARMRKDNTSGYRGVYWYKKSSCWRAQLNVNQTRCYLGYFDSPIDAAKAYDAAAIAAYGQFARLNFKQEAI